MTEYKNAPIVSVCVITYNHVQYIRECLQSIINQSTTFDFEIIVGDDASTDGTTEIVNEFSCKYPKVITAIFNNKNVGGCQNFRQVHQKSKGKYIAHIDGDDVMLPGKLQSQYLYHDANPDCVVSFHKLELISREGRSLREYWPLNAPQKFDCNYLIKKHPIVGHSSMMYRQGGIQGILKNEGDFIDLHEYIELGLQGTIGFLGDSFGKYRVGVGISSSRSLLPLVFDALDYAERKNIDRNTILYAKAYQALRYSLRELANKNYTEFNKLIHTSREICRISKTQKFIFSMRGLPLILHFLLKVYKFLKQLVKNARITQ